MHAARRGTFSPRRIDVPSTNYSRRGAAGNSTGWYINRHLRTALRWSRHFAICTSVYPQFKPEFAHCLASYFQLKIRFVFFYYTFVSSTDYMYIDSLYSKNINLSFVIFCNKRTSLSIIDLLLREKELVKISWRGLSIIRFYTLNSYISTRFVTLDLTLHYCILLLQKRIIRLAADHYASSTAYHCLKNYRSNAFFFCATILMSSQQINYLNNDQLVSLI